MSTSDAVRAELEQAMRATRESLQAELTKDMLQSMVTKCFKQCVTPGPMLTADEEQCIQACGEKYIGSRQLVAEEISRNMMANANRR